MANQLQALGGAKVVLATAANSDAMSATLDGLRHNGEFIVLGAPAGTLPGQPVPDHRDPAGHCTATRLAPHTMSKKSCGSPP